MKDDTVEVLVRIPKKDFEELQSNYVWWGRHGEYIRKGTVLPKGHGRLINETEILKFLRCSKYENCDWKNCSDCNESRCIDFNNIKSLVSMIEADKDESK